MRMHNDIGFILFRLIVINRKKTMNNVSFVTRMNEISIYLPLNYLHISMRF